MSRSATPAQMPEVAATLEREYSVVSSAIAMVACGAAPAVSVGGLRFGAELIRPAARLALQAGVRVVPLWTIDESRADIRIERLDSGGDE